MTHEINTVWSPELIGSLRKEYPRTAAFIGERFQELPTPEDLIVAFQAASRVFMQRADTRAEEAALILNEFKDRRKQGLTEGLDNALLKQCDAIRDTVNDLRVSDLLSKSSEMLSRFSASDEARNFYTMVVDELVEHIRPRIQRPKPSLDTERDQTEHALSTAIDYLPPLSKERFQKFQLLTAAA